MVALAVYAVVAAPIPFYDKGEPREAMVVRALLDGHGIALPRPDGIDLPAKPPAFHWLAGIAVAAGIRPEELAIRSPSIVLGAAGVAVTAGLAAAAHGTAAGLLAALVLGSSFEWMRAATQARVDMTLAVLLVGATLAWAVGVRERRARLVRLGWILATGAVLTKGPVGLVLPALIVAADALARRDGRALGALVDPLGIAVFAVIWSGWFALAWHAGGKNFLARQLVAENLHRFTGEGDVQHRHGALYYLPALAGGFAPWTLALPAAVTRLRRRPTAGDRLNLVWIAVVLLFFSLAAGKRSVYLLPLFPPLAVLTGAGLADALERAPSRAIRTAIAALAGLLAVAALALHWPGLEDALNGLGAFLPGSDGRRMPAVTALVRAEVPLLTALLLAAAGSLLALRTRRPATRLAGCAGLALLWTIGLPVLGTWPLARAVTSREGAVAVRDALAADDEPCAATYVDHGFRYYLGRPLRTCAEMRAHGHVPTIEIRRVEGPGDGRARYVARRLDAGPPGGPA